MALDDEIRDWWQETLLGQKSSAHPVFGSAIDVQVDGDVVTLTGTVQTTAEVEEIEREVQSLDLVRTVVNHLTALESGQSYRMQTVLALFPNEQSAMIARQATSAWTFHDDEPAEVFRRREDAESALEHWAAAARVPLSVVEPYLEALDQGKVLLADRVPEDDCLRIISALEGTFADMVRTLPPEPDGEESR